MRYVRSLYSSDCSYSVTKAVSPGSAIEAWVSAGPGDGDSREDPGALLGGALDADRPVTGFDPISEPGQARSTGRVGPTHSVVFDGDDELIRPVGQRARHSDSSGLRMLD